MMKTHPHHQLSAFLDRALPPQKAALVKQHLQQCPACQQELERQRQVHEVLSNLPTLALTQSPQAFWEEVRVRLSPQPRTLGLAWLWGAMLPFTVALLHGMMVLFTLVGVSSLLGFSPTSWLSQWWPTAIAAPALPGIVVLWYNSSLLGQFFQSTLAVLFPLFLIALVIIAVFSLFLGSLLATQSRPSAGMTV